MTVSGMQDQLRKGWERAVEEILFPVIKRLSNKVDTKHLSKVTVFHHRGLPYDARRVWPLLRSPSQLGRNAEPAAARAGSH